MVYKNLIQKELHQYRWVIWIGLGLTLSSVFLIVLSYELLGGVLKEVPIDIWERFRIGADKIRVLDDFTYYIWTQWNAKNLYQLGVILVFFLAVSQYAGEESKRNTSFLLTRPVSRGLVFAAKSTAGIIIILLVLEVSTLFLWVFSRIFGYQAIWSSIFPASLYGLLWLTVFYFFCCIFSITKTTPFSAGLSILTAGVLLSIPGWFKSLQKLSLFYQMRTVDYFIVADSPGKTILAALIFCGIFVYLAHQKFNQKDFS